MCNVQCAMCNNNNNNNNNNNDNNNKALKTGEVSRGG
jgi:hypothetical protein